MKTLHWHRRETWRKRGSSGLLPEKCFEARAIYNVGNLLFKAGLYIAKLNTVNCIEY